MPLFQTVSTNCDRIGSPGLRGSVGEREPERERERNSERKEVRDKWEKPSVCVCVCVCVSLSGGWINITPAGACETYRRPSPPQGWFLNTFNGVIAEQWRTGDTKMASQKTNSSPRPKALLCKPKTHSLIRAEAPNKSKLKQLHSRSPLHVKWQQMFPSVKMAA